MFNLAFLLFVASTFLAFSMACPTTSAEAINDQLDPKADAPNANETLVEATTVPAWKVKLEERILAAKQRRQELLAEAKKRREERLEKRKKLQENYKKWLRLSPERKAEEMKKWLANRRKERNAKAEEIRRRIRERIEAAKNRRNGVTATIPTPEVVEANSTEQLLVNATHQCVLSGNATGPSVDPMGNGTAAKVVVGNNTLESAGNTVGNAENAAGNTNETVEKNTTTETLLNALEKAENENAENVNANTAVGCPCPTAENQTVKQVDPPALVEVNKNGAGNNNSQQQFQENLQNVANSDEQKATETTVTQNQEQHEKEEQNEESANQQENSESANVEISVENDVTQKVQEAGQNQTASTLKNVQSASSAENPQSSASASPDNSNSATVATNNDEPRQKQTNTNAAKAPAVINSAKVDQKNEKVKKGPVEQKKEGTAPSNAKHVLAVKKDAPKPKAKATQ